MRPPTESWRRDARAGGLVVAAGVILAAFAGLAFLLAFFDELVRLDQTVSAAVRSLAAPWLDAFAGRLTDLGSFVGMTVLTSIAAAWYLVRKRRSEAVFLALTVGLGALVGNLLKPLIGRERPPLEFARIPQPDSYSFPSGHALASLLFFGGLVFLVMTAEEDLPLKARAWLSGALALLGLGVSLSRVYLGVHYFGDIIGAWLLGSAILTIGVVGLLAATRGMPHD